MLSTSYGGNHYSRKQTCHGLTKHPHYWRFTSLSTPTCHNNFRQRQHHFTPSH
jgi:hypothetical protein